METMTKDVREPKWIKWLALAIAFAIILIFMAVSAEACPSGPNVRQHATMIVPRTTMGPFREDVQSTVSGTTTATVRQHIQSTLPGTTIGAIRKTPMAGVYEIQMGKTIAYTNSQGKLFIVGHMYDPSHNRDLTAERLADLHRIQWKDLPLKDAIISGPKNGVKMAVFTDPECPYCRHLETMMKGMKGIRIYTFLFPLESIHPQARAMAESIWCAKNRHKALLSVMLDGKTLKSGTCDTSVIDRNIQLARKFGINGTPGLISGTGRISAGSPQSKTALRAWLAQK